MANPTWDETEEVSSQSQILSTENMEMESLTDIPSWENTQDIIPAQKETLSKLESGLRGAAQGVTFGFADELTGALEAAKDVASSEATLKDILDLYKQRRDESRQAYESAQEANPLTYGASEIASGLLIPGLGAAKTIKSAPSVLNALKTGVKTGAITGGISGAGYTEQNELPKMLEEVGKSAALGGTLGGVLGGASGVISKYRSRPLMTGMRELEDNILKEGPGSISKKQVKEVGEISSNLSGELKKLNKDLMGERELKLTGKPGETQILIPISDIIKKNQNTLNDIQPFDDVSSKQIKNAKSILKGILENNEQITPDRLENLNKRIEAKIKQQFGENGDPLLADFYKNLKEELRERLHSTADISPERKKLSSLFKIKEVLGDDFNKESLIDLAYQAQSTTNTGQKAQLKIADIIDNLSNIDPKISNKFKSDIEKLGLKESLAKELAPREKFVSDLKQHFFNIPGYIENVVGKKIDPKKPSKLPELIGRPLAKLATEEKSEYSLPITNKIERQKNEVRDPELKFELDRISNMPTEKQATEYFKLQSNQKFREELEKLRNKE